MTSATQMWYGPHVSRQGSARAFSRYQAISRRRNTAGLISHRAPPATSSPLPERFIVSVYSAAPRLLYGLLRPRLRIAIQQRPSRLTLLRMIKNQPRRDFLKQTALAAASAALPVSPFASFAQTQQAPAPAVGGQRPAAAAVPPSPSAPRPHFPTADPAWAATWDAALAVLAGNVRTMPRYDHPVLVEGSTYAGIWQECAPQEGLVYGTLARSSSRAQPGSPSPLAVARANHMAFFAQQKPDGQLPASIKLADKVGTDAGYGQIQMVVPIAATAWELAQQTHDDELLTTTYASCSRWDAWLRQYRDTRKTGLCEGFCTYDTGMDYSPRWNGIPNRCPDADARKCPPDPTMPRLCPDLSATVYGGRIALAAMARALGKSSEESRWLADAKQIRQLILSKLYSPEDAAFYDLDAQNNFVRVRSVVNLRVLGEHVLDPHKDRAIFDAVWTRPGPQPRSLLGALSIPLLGPQRAHLRPSHPAQQLGRGQPGAHRSARAALDVPLRQAGRAHPPHAAVVRGHHAPHRVPPADRTPSPATSPSPTPAATPPPPSPSSTSPAASAAHSNP